MIKQETGTSVSMNLGRQIAARFGWLLQMIHERSSDMAFENRRPEVEFFGNIPASDIDYSEKRVLVRRKRAPARRPSRMLSDKIAQWSLVHSKNTDLIDDIYFKELFWATKNYMNSPYNTSEKANLTFWLDYTNLPDKESLNNNILIISYATRNLFDPIKPQELKFPAPAWYSEVVERIDMLSKKKEGWKGQESHEMKPFVRKLALTFLRKLIHEGVDRRPTVGLDYEGTVSFSWIRDDISADLTIYEDGTYSYYAEKDDNTAGSDETSLSEPLDPKLVSILCSK